MLCNVPEAVTQKSEKENSLQWNLLAVISAEVIIPLFMLLKPNNHCCSSLLQQRQLVCCYSCCVCVLCDASLPHCTIRIYRSRYFSFPLSLTNSSRLFSSVFCLSFQAMILLCLSKMEGKNSGIRVSAGYVHSLTRSS